MPRLTTTMNRRGFSLIELMIAVAIVAILAAIAYPSYRNYVRRSNRTEATSQLVDIAAREEKYFADQNTYVTDLTQLGFGANPFVTQHAYYSIAVAADTATNAANTIANSFLVTATAQGGQADDASCAKFTLNNVGAKSDTSGGTCWE